MCAVSLFDRLELKPAEAFYLEVARSEFGGDVPADERNLALRAAVLLRQRLGVRPGQSRGALVHLEKRIPVGAGLGGGSSDAAAVLVGLSRLWHVASQPDLLSGAASQVGSDVPFFLSGGCRMARGRGELISPAPMLPDCHVVIGCPPFTVQTGLAYELLSSHNRALRSSAALTDALSKGDLQEVGRNLANDFEEVIFPRRPLLADLKSAALQAGASGSALTGSGSAVFALAEDEVVARAVADSWADRARVFFARPLPQGVRLVIQGVGPEEENT